MVEPAVKLTERRGQGTEDALALGLEISVDNAAHVSGLSTAAWG